MNIQHLTNGGNQLCIVYACNMKPADLTADDVLLQLIDSDCLNREFIGSVAQQLNGWLKLPILTNINHRTGWQTNFF